MSTQTEVDTTTVAKVAASRAQALRDHAEELSSAALAPLRRALLIRAGELELAANVLLDEPEPVRPHLRAIA
jgi:hypothetical protein